MRVTKNKLKSEYGALSGDVKAANATPSKKKIGNGGSVSASGTPAKSTPKSTPAPVSTGKRGRKTVVVEKGEGDGCEDDEVEEESPTKKAKKGGKAGGVKAEPVEEDGLDDIFQ